MKKKTIIFLVLLIIFLLISVSFLNAQDSLRYFVDGHKYLDFSKYEKGCYVAGMIDTVCAILINIEPEAYHEIVEAFNGMTVSQIVKMLNKYLEENPEELHISAAISFLNVIREL